MSIEDDIAFLERVPTLALMGREALRVSAIEIPGCPACGDGLLNARQALELIRNLVDHQEPRRRRRP